MYSLRLNLPVEFVFNWDAYEDLGCGAGLDEDEMLLGTLIGWNEPLLTVYCNLTKLRSLVSFTNLFWSPSFIAFRYSYLRFSIVFYLVRSSFLKMSNFTLSSFMLFLSSLSSYLNLCILSYSFSLLALNFPISKLSTWSSSAYSFIFFALLSKFSFSMVNLSVCSIRLSCMKLTFLVSSSHSAYLAANSFSC